DGAFSSAPPHRESATGPPDDDSPFVARAQSMLAAASARDPLAFDLRATGVALTGWRILNLLTRTATRSDAVVGTIDQTLAAACGERLRRGETIDGFGHPLYRNGDPRADALLDLLRDRYARSAELAFVLDVAGAAVSVTRERPSIDFALAALARVLRLPSGSPLTLFAIGRTIGWIGHAIEQYATGQLIRPRAKYVGAVPGAP